MKNILFDAEAMNLLKAGVDKLANVVKSTLGPGGSNVILERNGRHHVTKDGVTIAREIDLPDPVENLGAQIIKAAASKTADGAGDGTTTATVLAQAILTAGIKHVVAGANRIDLKRGMDIAVKAIVQHLKAMSKPVKDGDIRKIANISSNGDSEITELITEAINKVGRDGIIIVEDARGTESSLVLADGSKFDRGWLSNYFVTDPGTMECVLDNPYILIFDGVITGFKAELLKPLQELTTIKGNVPVLIIAHDIQGEALMTLCNNKMQKGFAFCAVQAADYGETRTQVLQDLAALTGGKVISKAEGLTLNNMTVEMFGTCGRVRVTQWSTTIIGGSGGGLMARIDSIQKQMEEANPNALEKLKDRIARLTSKMGVLYVGGPTEVEIREKKDRIDDALMATRSALDEGILVGGGVAYLRALQAFDEYIKSDEFEEQCEKNGPFVENDDQETGINIIRQALLVPIQIIAQNVGKSGEVVLNDVLNAENDWGFNAKTLDYEYLIEAGVIDPAKVVRLALENAASVAGMILTTKSVVSEIPEPEKLMRVQ